MPLVDYSSDSDDSSSSTDLPESPPKKKPRFASSQPGPAESTSPPSTAALPPLPASFHDLYASTVRTTTTDDPALHQGRTRQIPHVPGNWPTHIYIEWRPPSPVHTLLADLVALLQSRAAKVIQNSLSSNNNSHGDDHERRVDITSFLLSELATPQPLHISLSRPIVLALAEKDAFLDEIEAGLRASGIPQFTLRCSGVEWHRTEESRRSFLVMRVVRSSARAGTQDHKSDRELRTGPGPNPDSNPNPNPELTEWLRRCNSVVAKYRQPQLYPWADGEGERQVGEAFHLSIAWSFAEPTEELRALTERVFGESGTRERIREIEIPVDGVKVKIGNVVSHVALSQPGRTANGKGARNLLGL